MTLRTMLVAGACALTVAACSGGSSSGTTPTGGTTPDPEGTTGGSTGTSTGSSTGGSPATVPTPGTDGGIPVADCSAGCVTLVGNVFRQAGTKATHGGKGPLYFALFDGNPITGASSSTLVTATTVADADLGADDAKVPYKLGPFAVSAKELQLMVFLDDDRNVDPAAPGPGKGDLVSLSLQGGIGGIRVKATAAGDLPVDVALTAAIP